MAQWEGKTRGNLLGYKIFVWFIRNFGLPATYWLLKHVSLYFFLFAFKPRHVMVKFYTQGMGLGYIKALLLTRKNFFMIGQSLVDKVAALIGKASRLTYRMNGDHYLKEMALSGTGGMLISAHLGNYEIAGNMLRDFKVVTNVVMFDAEHEQIKQYLAGETGGARFNVIAIKNDLSHIFLIKQALERGELVCIHADRFLPGTRTLTMPFLSRQARFPYGPFHLASKFSAPVTFVFGVKSGKYNYQLSATKPLSGGQAPEVYAGHFVKVLEEKLKLYPEQWFNYYDFFKMND